MIITPPKCEQRESSPAQLDPMKYVSLDSRKKDVRVANEKTNLSIMAHHHFCLNF